MAKSTDKQIEAMRKLGFSEDEIADVLKSDDAIDHGEKVAFDLDPEKEKEAKKYIKSGTRKASVNYQLDNTGGKRNRKENPTKNAIITEVAKFLEETSENACENVVIVNKERLITFTISGTNYELTLVQKRPPK